MRKQEFIDKLYNAGWDDSHDAQHDGATKLFNELFPVYAEVERLADELMKSECLLDEIGAFAHMHSSGIDDDLWQVRQKAYKKE